jgi:hypothetical protein
MSRNDLRNNYPFHNVQMREPATLSPIARYNRNSLRHKVKALIARIRNAII